MTEQDYYPRRVEHVQHLEKQSEDQATLGKVKWLPLLQRKKEHIELQSMTLQ
jgi:hypothetical protein